jgi:hypothetical protein
MAIKTNIKQKALSVSEELEITQVDEPQVTCIKFVEDLGILVSMLNNITANKKNTSAMCNY